MDTKKKILDVALTLFSEKGYGNVYVGQIAEGVGIKAPSLYKHYKSKQDVFEAILEEMRNRYNKEAAHLNITGNDFQLDSEIYNNISKIENEELEETVNKAFTFSSTGTGILAVLVSIFISG